MVVFSFIACDRKCGIITISVHTVSLCARDYFFFIYFDVGRHNLDLSNQSKKQLKQRATKVK